MRDRKRPCDGDQLDGGTHVTEMFCGAVVSR
jgi:hypothetical protein